MTAALKGKLEISFKIVFKSQIVGKLTKDGLTVVTHTTVGQVSAQTTNRSVQRDTTRLRSIEASGVEAAKIVTINQLCETESVIIAASTSKDRRQLAERPTIVTADTWVAQDKPKGQHLCSSLPETLN